MSNEYKLEVFKREDEGKRGLKELRRNDKIPGVYYSHDSKQSIAFYIEQTELRGAIKSGAHIFSIAVGSKTRSVIFKSVQYHPVTDQVLHIDLYGVKMDTAVTVKATIELIGDAVGVKEEGGVLSQSTTEIEIECLPLDIPDSIKVNIEALAIGDSIRVGDLELDDKLTLKSSDEAVVCSVTQPMREEEVVTEEVDEDFMDEEEGTPSEESSDSDSGEQTEE
jgi:large subunit ribosomal protein L25